MTQTTFQRNVFDEFCDESLQRKSISMCPHKRQEDKLSPFQSDSIGQTLSASIFYLPFFVTPRHGCPPLMPC